tara:strand:- start:2403 stop:2765 length:363 start_codon:yes stop_codon:yes gene_type:complete
MRLESDLENVFFHNMLLANVSCLKNMNIIINMLGWNVQHHSTFIFLANKLLGNNLHQANKVRNALFSGVFYSYQFEVPDSIFLRQIKRFFNNVTDPSHLVDPRGLSQWIPTTFNSTRLSF